MTGGLVHRVFGLRNRIAIVPVDRDKLARVVEMGLAE